MGALLVGRVPPFTHLAALLLLAVALSCLRRDVERDEPGWGARGDTRVVFATRIALYRVRLSLDARDAGGRMWS